MDVEAARTRRSRRRNRRWSNESLGNFRQFSPAVKNHLKKVCMTLCCAMLTSAAGVYLHLLWNIAGGVTVLARLWCIAGLFYTPSSEVQRRLGLLMAYSLFNGGFTGLLINQAIDIDPSISIAAFAGVAVAFACLTTAAMLARRREYLYLTGLLASGVFILLVLLIASIFTESAATFEFWPYFGLLVFLGYVVVDTQEIVEKAYQGDMDYVKHAVTLFTNFAAIFVRVLIIIVIPDNVHTDSSSQPFL